MCHASRAGGVASAAMDREALRGRRPASSRSRGRLPARREARRSRSGCRSSATPTAGVIVGASAHMPVTSAPGRAAKLASSHSKNRAAPRSKARDVGSTTVRSGCSWKTRSSSSPAAAHGVTRRASISVCARALPSSVAGATVQTIPRTTARATASSTGQPAARVRSTRAKLARAIEARHRVPIGEKRGGPGLDPVDEVDVPGSVEAALRGRQRERSRERVPGAVRCRDGLEQHRSGGARRCVDAERMMKRANLRPGRSPVGWGGVVDGRPFRSSPGRLRHAHHGEREEG